MTVRTRRALARASSVLALAATVMATVHTAGAQQVAYAATVNMELDSVTQAAVMRELAGARARGIPAEALVAKVREGKLKGAPGVRIRAAVVALAARLDSARAALGPQSSADELIAGADAIAAGATPVSLRALRAASALPIAVPIGTLAQLVASGVSPQRAVDMVVALLRRNAAPAVLVAFGNRVEADVASGLRPDESALFRLRGIEAVTFGGMGDALTAASAPVPTPPVQPGPGVKVTPKRRP